MDHVRILGTVPSPVILSQIKLLKKLESDAPKLQEQAEAKKDCVTV